MSKRGRFGALAGALLLTFAVAGIAIAAAPTYSIDVTKTATPATVPAGGGSVTYWVAVHNTGTGDLKVVNWSDSIAGCALVEKDGHPTGPSDKLDAGGTWNFSCTVANTAPNTTNTVTVWACHDGSVDQCNNDNHSATDTASVTVGLTAAAATPTPTPKKATAPNTATVESRTSSSDGTWLAIVALGVLLASVVILTPRRAKSRE
jgi:hypothetical protein